MRLLILASLLGCVILFGCGESGQPSRSERETSAVERLLREEDGLRSRASDLRTEGRHVIDETQSCATAACIEAGGTLLASANRKVDHLSARLDELHRKINRYRRPAIEAALARLP